jgi:hypothetical protein
MSRSKSAPKVAAALAIAAVAFAQPATADTLKYIEPAYAPWDGSFTIQDGSPYRAPVTIRAGAFEMKDISGPTLPVGTTFEAWCVDIYHFLNTSSSGTTYTLRDGDAFYAGSNSYKDADLERLASYVFDSDLLTNNVQSAAFQLAVWEIVNDSAGHGFYNVGYGDFKVTSGDGSAIAKANEWLGIVNAGTYAISQRLDVWHQNIPGSTQDLAVFAPIPEPETYAMILAGLGLMGFVARRRRSRRLV